MAARAKPMQPGEMKRLPSAAAGETDEELLDSFVNARGVMEIPDPVYFKRYPRRFMLTAHRLRAAGA